MQQNLATALPAVDGPSIINTTGIQGWIGLAIFIILSVVALKLFMKSDKGDVKGATHSGIVIFIGCLILAVAAGGLWASIGSGALGSIFSAG